MPVKNNDKEQPKAPPPAKAPAPAYANKGKAKMFDASVNEDVEDHEVIEGMLYFKHNKVHIIGDTKVHILFNTGCMYSYISLQVVKRQGLCMTLLSIPH